MAARKNSSVMQNKHVKELLGIMEENKTDTMKDLMDILDYVGKMEKQLATAIQEVDSMKTQMEALKDNNPIKKVLQATIAVMQDSILALRDNLKAMKQNIIEGCKNAVTAFKENGISALNNIGKFFKVKPQLESIRNNVGRAIAQDNKAISKIEAISTEYHKAGRHVANIGRAIMGKEPIQEVKPIGKLAKAVQAPYRFDRSCLIAMHKVTNAAVKNLAKLEKTAEKKPSIAATMQKFNKQIEEAKKDAPTRLNPAHADR